MPDPAPQNFARSDAFKLTVWFLATAVLGAFLAPVIHVVGTAIVAGGHLEGGPADWVHSEMVKAEFGRYFNRAILMAALLLLYPMSRWLGLESGWGWMGLRPNPYRWKDLGLGFFLAAGSLLVVALVYLQLGWYRLREPMPSVPGVLGGAVFTGFSVAVLEECLFRGVLFGILLRSLSERTSLWFLSAFFALLHFLKPPEGGGTLENVDWLSGFTMLGRIALQFQDPWFFAAEFATLFAVGWVLGYARLRSASLWLSIGLHAGWVFGIKAFSPLARRALRAERIWPWAGENLRIGLVTLALVILAGVVVWAYLRHRHRRTESPGASAGKA